MTSNLLFANWLTVAPALGNHLWQSTLCLVMAGLLTLAFRKNHARVRYGLWLAASVKFLVPFLLLFALGSSLAKPHVVYQTETGCFSAMQEASQPFARPPAHEPSPVAFSATPPNLLPAILTAIWFGGFAAVLILWFIRWRRISSTLRRAEPLRGGRELDALRRLERSAGIRKPIELVSSPARLEPGIFGIFKPVMIWPQGISQHLNDAHLEAVLAHEIWHVRRHDNLASAIHMLVQAIFWFHPMVWWLASRLIEERERACDEEVLLLGSKPSIYAESILKTCEFCVESPLACVSGVTGAYLKKRIVHIMTERMATKLTLGRKLLLTAIGIAAVAGPFAFGVVCAPKMYAQLIKATGSALPSFEVASIKPDPSPSGLTMFQGILPSRFTAKHVTATALIAYAYNIRDFQISGGPTWTKSAEYDIIAKPEDSETAKLANIPWDRYRKEYGLLVQSLLADRFKLKVSYSTKELPVYALVVARNGSKLIPTNGYPKWLGPGPKRGPWIRVGSGQLTSIRMSIGAFSDALSDFPELGGHSVLDQTGLQGSYDISLRWTPDQKPAAMFEDHGEGKSANENTRPPESSDPSFFTALQEQLGLKLVPTKGPLEVLVIEHIERPSEN